MRPSECFTELESSSEVSSSAVSMRSRGQAWPRRAARIVWRAMYDDRTLNNAAGRLASRTNALGEVVSFVGTPSELVAEQGDIAWHTRSTLWGTTTWATNSTAYTPLRFPGQYYDPETGLHYNYFRHYDPETARYLTSDPLGLGPAPNPAAYVHNPHTWTDPLGLVPYTPLREGYTSQPAFEKDPYAPGIVDERIKDMRKLYGVKDPDVEAMIGANGTQITSKTLWNHGPYRIDVENPNPGERPGQLHFQDQSNKGAKYQYDFESGKFEGLPRSIEKAVGGTSGFIGAIRKGLAALGEG